MFLKADMYQLTIRPLIYYFYSDNKNYKILRVDIYLMRQKTLPEQISTV
jgi:hypothetical protein